MVETARGEIPAKLKEVNASRYAWDEKLLHARVETNSSNEGWSRKIRN
jgi:hypothetical protein